MGSNPPAGTTLQQYCSPERSEERVCECLTNAALPGCSFCSADLINTGRAWVECFNCVGLAQTDQEQFELQCLQPSNSTPTSPSETSSQNLLGSTDIQTPISSPAPTSAPTAPTTSGIPSAVGTIAVSTESSTPTPPANSGLSTGAKAGIGVGIALAAVLIAGFIVFFVFRRRRNRQSYASRPLEEKAYAAPGYANERAGAGVKGAVTVSNLEEGLSQPAEDDAISGGVSKLRDRIKNHVQSYYHTIQVDDSSISDSHLQNWANSTGRSSISLKEMLLNPETRHVALRSYIAWQILSRCNGAGKEVPSLLPGEISKLAQNINNATGQEAKLAIQRKNSTARTMSQNGGTMDASVKREIVTLLEVMEPVLKPFASAGQSSDERIRNLDGVMTRAAEFAFLLFSQPSLWKFNWSTSKQGDIVVMPALQQLVNEEGRTLIPPKVFNQAEIAHR